MKALNRKALVWKLTNRIAFQQSRMEQAEADGDKAKYAEARAMGLALNLVHGEIQNGEYDH